MQKLPVMLETTAFRPALSRPAPHIAQLRLLGRRRGGCWDTPPTPMRGSTSGSGLERCWPLANRRAGRAGAVAADWPEAGRGGAEDAGSGPGAGRRVGRMRLRLRSGALAAGCLLAEALGVALFLRGFFPLPVRSLPRGEARAQPPAEPAPPGPGRRLGWSAVSRVLSGVRGPYSALQCRSVVLSCFRACFRSSLEQK